MQVRAFEIYIPLNVPNIVKAADPILSLFHTRSCQYQEVDVKSYIYRIPIRSNGHILKI